MRRELGTWGMRQVEVTDEGVGRSGLDGNRYASIEVTAFCTLGGCGGLHVYMCRIRRDVLRRNRVALRLYALRGVVRSDEGVRSSVVLLRVVWDRKKNSLLLDAVVLKLGAYPLRFTISDALPPA